MKRSARKFTMILMGIFLISLAVSATASANRPGGKDIATAWPVTYGQQEFGNTAESAPITTDCGLFGAFGGCCETSRRQFWSVAVQAGDQLTVDWESQALTTELKLAPVGTTDYTLFQIELAGEQSLAANGKNEFVYTAPQTGTMPLYFKVCEEKFGPYDFTATLQRALAVSLDKVVQIGPEATLTGHASFLDGTPAPDGLSFVLAARWPDEGSAVFSATSSGGSLSFPVSLPETAWGHTVRFVLKRPADAQYLEAKSVPMKVKVTKPVYCVVPYLRGQTLKQAKRSLRRNDCRLGNVRKSRRRNHTQRVIRQKPKPGMVLPVSSRVSVVIG